MDISLYVLATQNYMCAQTNHPSSSYTLRVYDFNSNTSSGFTCCCTSGSLVNTDTKQATQTNLDGHALQSWAHIIASESYEGKAIKQWHMKEEWSIQTALQFLPHSRNRLIQQCSNLSIHNLKNPLHALQLFLLLLQLMCTCIDLCNTLTQCLISH